MKIRAGSLFHTPWSRIGAAKADSDATACLKGSRAPMAGVETCAGSGFPRLSTTPHRLYTGVWRFALAGSGARVQSQRIQFQKD